MPARHGFFSALPAYLGGKRRLAPLIYAELDKVLERPRSSVLLLDAFSGGGALSLMGKALGFSVVASDIAEIASTVACALVANSSVRLRPEDILDLFRGEDERMAGEVGDGFSAQETARLMHFLARADRRPEPVRSLLRLVIIRVALRLRPMSILTATDARHFIAGDLDRISDARLRHYMATPRVFEPATLLRIASAVNKGVIGGTGTALHGDALTAIRDVQPHVLVLDPPYPGVTGYVDTYGPLEALLGGGRSPVSAPPDIDELLDVARDVPLVVLTYGGRGITLADLTAQVGEHRPVLRAMAIPYPHLAALATKEHARENHELVVIAGR